MSNDESLSLVESAISECEHECETLDQLSENAATSRQTIQKLESDLVDIRANTAGLEPKLRSSRHVATGSTLTLEHADLAAIENQIDTQSDRVVQVGQRAKSLLAQIHAALLQSRKSGIEAMLEATFDLRLLRIHTPSFASAAFSVQEVEEFQGTIFQHRFLPRDRDVAIDDARKLRERAAALLTMAENESGLELDIIDVELTPVQRAIPSTPVNVLGTLAQAVAA
jgi:hypothetical protein